MKLKPQFRPFKTEENEAETHKIAVMVLRFVFVCLFWRLRLVKAIKKRTVGFAAFEREDGMLVTKTDQSMHALYLEKQSTFSRF